MIATVLNCACVKYPSARQMKEHFSVKEILLDNYTYHYVPLNLYVIISFHRWPVVFTRISYVS